MARHQRRSQAARRAVQREERRSRNQARGRGRRWLYWISSGTIGALIIVSFTITSLPTPVANVPTGEEAMAIIPEGQRYLGYTSSPPTYGPHWPTGAAWGVRTEDIPDERQVRNLAEGGVLIQYNTDNQGLIDQLEQFALRQSDFPCYLIVAPFERMEATIAVTAWGAMETMDVYDEEQLQEFVDTFRGTGPELVSCAPLR